MLNSWKAEQWVKNWAFLTGGHAQKARDKDKDDKWNPRKRQKNFDASGNVF